MQQLQLTALQCPPPELPHSIHIRFGQGGGRIGRHRDCELALPDPERHISREHAEIRWRDGAFVLRVLSKVNGVLVNGRPVEPGDSAPLADGDRVQIGDYVLQARMLAAEQPAAWASADDPFACLAAAAPQGGGASPFDALKALIQDGAGAQPASRSEAFTGAALAAAKAPTPTPTRDGPAPELESWSIEDIDRILGLGAAAPAGAQPSSDPDASGTNINGAAIYRAHDIDLPFNAAAVPPAKPAASGDGGGAELVRVLAEALGLEPGELDETRPRETIRLAGMLLKGTLEGLHKMLEMRAQLKSELRIEDRTMIASRENNPLKHGDLHDALTYLVDLRQHGNKLFLAPQKAVQDAVWDVCAHEMAVMAGTRAALLASLRLFSPEVVESRIKRSGALDAVLPAFHKSKLWEKFLELHSALEREAEDHFDQLLNQEFAKAYAEQSRRLRNKS